MLQYFPSSSLSTMAAIVRYRCLLFFTFSLLTFCRAPSWQNVVNFPSTALWWWWQSSLSPPPTLANKKRLEGSILLLPYLQCTVAKKEGKEVVFLRFSFRSLLPDYLLIYSLFRCSNSNNVLFKIFFRFYRLSFP